MPGNKIDGVTKEAKIGHNRVMSGTLDNERFHFFMMKEPAFFMKMIMTYGDLNTNCNQEKTRRYFKNSKGDTEKRKIKYSTVFANHFKYRHIVDNNNNLRHSFPSFEETSRTV